MGIGDRWSPLRRPVEPVEIQENWVFSKIAKSRQLDFLVNCIFWQTKIFETWTFDKKRVPKSIWPQNTNWVLRWLRSDLVRHFGDFLKIEIFHIFDFTRKLTIGSNDVGETWESVSCLDLSIQRLDISPTHAGNCTFWVKNRDFCYISGFSHIWSRINKIELHQQNSILLM